MYDSSASEDSDGKDQMNYAGRNWNLEIMGDLSNEKTTMANDETYDASSKTGECKKLHLK